MNTRAVVIGIACALAVLVLTAVAWLLLQPKAGDAPRTRHGKLLTATNPALNLRYSYDGGVFAPAQYDSHAEYPLRLDAQGYSFYTKRIKGAGTLLGKEPGGILYDFVGSTHIESLVQYYKLEPVGEPFYEDAQIGGKLGLHQAAQYNAGPNSTWPEYFPEEYASASPPVTAFVEAWAVFTDKDLFFFLAVSSRQLTSDQRQTCQQVMDSLQFDAVLGETEEGAQTSGEDAAAAGEPQAGAGAMPGEDAKPKEAEPAPAPAPAPEPAPALDNGGGTGN